MHRRKTRGQKQGGYDAFGEIVVRVCRIDVHCGGRARRGRRRQDRRAHRHVEPVFGHQRRGLGCRGKIGGRGLQPRRARHEGRSDQRRPSKQTGYRSRHRPAVVRCRSRRRRRRRADLERGAGDQRARPRKEQGFPWLRPGQLRPHRAEMFAEHDPVDLRHLDARPRNRQGGGSDRGRHLVLPHRRLRLRPRARTRHFGGGHRQWARCSAMRWCR